MFLRRVHHPTARQRHEARRQPGRDDGSVGVVRGSIAIVGFNHPARLADQRVVQPILALARANGIDAVMGSVRTGADWEHDRPHAHLHGDAMEGGESVDVERRHRPARYQVIRVTVADGG